MAEGWSSSPSRALIATSMRNFSGISLPVVWLGEAPIWAAIASAGKKYEVFHWMKIL